jgi:hypothetical protein
MNRAVVRPLTPREVALLNEAEETIAAGLTTFIEVGAALLTVRDERLYRREFATFEDYCVAKWQISRPHAYRLMDAARVVSPMGDIENPPTNERQVRELGRVPEEKRVEVWDKANERTDGQPTAADVRAAANETAGVAAPAPDGGQATTPSGTAAAGDLGGPPVAAQEPVLPGRKGVGAPENSSHAQGFSGEETGPSAGTDDPAPPGSSDPAGSSAVTGVPAPEFVDTPRCNACGQPLQERV